MPDFLTAKDYKASAEDTNAIAEKGIIKGYNVAIAEKGINEESRTVEWTITTDDIDRDHDVVSADGWDLKNYQKNPVVLWAHQMRELPIARSINIEKAANGLVSTSQFPTRDEYDFADTVFNLIKGGFLKAVSVGFMPLEWKWAENDARPLGWDILKAELYEYSVVPVPANPHALVRAKAAGINVEPLRQWAERCLDELNSEEGAISNQTLQLAAAAKNLDELITLLKNGSKTISIIDAVKTPALEPEPDPPPILNTTFVNRSLHQRELDFLRLKLAH